MWTNSAGWTNIAGGNKEALLFKNGEIISKISEDKIVECILDYLNNV